MRERASVRVQQRPEINSSKKFAYTRRIGFTNYPIIIFTHSKWIVSGIYSVRFVQICETIFKSPNPTKRAKILRHKLATKKNWTNLCMHKSLAICILFTLICVLLMTFQSRLLFIDTSSTKVN